MELVFTRDNQGNELLGLKTNINTSNEPGNADNANEQFPLLNLGFKYAKESREIKGWLPVHPHAHIKKTMPPELLTLIIGRGKQHRVSNKMSENKIF